MHRCGGCGTRGMALYRARDRRHEYGRWWHHATFCELHSMHKLPKLSIAQMRQAKPTAAPLTGTAPALEPRVCGTIKNLSWQ